MRDIGIAWDTANGRGDWADAAQDAAYAALPNAVDGDLVAAALVSLFTDRRASADFVPPDRTGDRRGWWADAYEPDPIGSRLWQLERARRTPQTLLQARDCCTEALAWMQRDGIAANIGVLTFWAGRTALGIRVTLQLVGGPANSLGELRGTATVETSMPLGI